MKRLLLLFFTCLIIQEIHAQTFMPAENDTTVISEYFDGRIWAYRQIGNFVVGMTNYKEKDDYGRYYQIGIFIKNIGEESTTFYPEEVTADLYDNWGDTVALTVYSYERYMKKIKRAQAWSMALLGFSSGLNAGMAGYQTTYTTTYRAGHIPYTQVHTTYNYAAASAARMAATTQILTLGKLMENDRNIKSQGYLKTTTIHSDEAIIGYMNIKRKNGKIMRVNIPIGNQVYSFDWDLSKKK